jgi:hypothetical protein
LVWKDIPGWLGLDYRDYIFVKLTQVNKTYFLCFIFILFCSFIFNGLLIEIHHLSPFEKKKNSWIIIVTFF